MTNTYFHTQEYRPPKRLQAPLICIRDDAWLGEGYYFWFDEDDAHDWGSKSKRRTKLYDIYKCSVEEDEILDTVFNMEHYYFWLRQLEAVARAFIKKTSLKPTLKELNEFLKEKGVWEGVKGIRFQDLPTNPNKSLLRTSKPGELLFPYKKRIQLVVYDIDIVRNFAHFKCESCT